MPSDRILTALSDAVRAVGLALDADRCWLYARADPPAGIALVRWLRDERVPDVPPELHEWTEEAPGLAREDPLFARALAGEPADVIDDVPTAPVNAGLERALGHRAFVHLNLHADGRLVGVLQPGMTSAPRSWTAEERTALLALRPALAPLLVAAAAERPPSRRLVG